MCVCPCDCVLCDFVHIGCGIHTCVSTLRVWCLCPCVGFSVYLSTSVSLWMCVSCGSVVLMCCVCVRADVDLWFGCVVWSVSWWMWWVGGLVWLLSLWLEGVVFAYGSLGACLWLSRLRQLVPAYSGLCR